MKPCVGHHRPGPQPGRHRRCSMLVGKDIVMITPTATDDGIAALGPNIFQMNIPWAF